MTNLEFLEGASYVATLGLLVVAVIGLRQLTISRRTSQIAAQRDATKCANEQVRYYLEQIIAEITQLDKEIKQENIKVFQKASVKFKENGIEVESNMPPKLASKEISIVSDNLVKVLNAMEAFSSYFVSGLADEKIAFKSVGRTFCSSVKKYGIVLALVDHDGYYQNIIELYRMWDGRIEAEQLSTQRSEIEKKLENIKDKALVPIGANE